MSFCTIKIVFFFPLLGPLTDLLEEEGEIPGESRQNSGRRRQDWAFLPRPKTPGSTTSSSESYVVRILQSHHFFYHFCFFDSTHSQCLKITQKVSLCHTHKNDTLIFKQCGHFSVFLSLFCHTFIFASFATLF